MSRKRQKIERVGVVAKVASRTAVHVAHELAEWLRRRGLEAVLDEATLRAKGISGDPPFRPEEPYDLVIALGGDGTLLATARNLSPGVPILGVNLGNLGFLTEVGRGGLYPALVAVLAGKFTLEERSLLDVELRRSGRQDRAAGGAQTRPAGSDTCAPSSLDPAGPTSGGVLSFRVLNDAVVTKSALARIIELSLKVDGYLIARYRSDGVIISTPTGSTAYNLSAGGPIVHPLLPVVVLTPICPHTLSLRPIVVPADGLIEVTLETQREEVYLTCDGQEGTSLGHRDTVSVTRSSTVVRLVKVDAPSFYDNLRVKLRWGGLTSNGPEPPA
jgi:NAD+ kinase